MPQEAEKLAQSYTYHDELNSIIYSPTFHAVL